jgi:PAS domain S-box-containing protein
MTAERPATDLADLLLTLSDGYGQGLSLHEVACQLLPSLRTQVGASQVVLGQIQSGRSTSDLLQLWAVSPPGSSSPVQCFLASHWPQPMDEVLGQGQVRICDRLVGLERLQDERMSTTLPAQGPWLLLPLMHAGHVVGLLGVAHEGHGCSPQALQRSLKPLAALLGGMMGTQELAQAQRAALLAQTVAQDSLQRNRADYQQLFEVAGVGIACVGTDGRLLDVNQRYADICRRDRHLLIGMNARDITHPDDRPADLAMIEATFHGQQDRYSLEKRYLCPLGDMVWVQVTAVLVRDAKGTPQHFVSVVEDISQRRQYQEAILSAQAAERASKAKTEFLSRMSHELRTPLNAMLGFAQLLRVDPRHPLIPAQKQKVLYIEQAGAHLLAMLTDVLDLSRIEAGSLPLSLEPLRVRSALSEAQALVHHQAVDQGLSLQVGDVPDQVFVRADHVRLRQVLVNLLSNAIKYNRPKGHVRLEVQVLKPHVIFSVQDSGVGLSAEQQSHLFEPFNRLGAERTGVDGTGIGLVIVRRLVALMNGRVEVSSVPGEGSVFRVVLPWSAPPVLGTESAEPSGFGDLTPAPGEPRQLHLLYAEDNVINVELVRQVLRMRPQWHLDIAVSGAEAITMALAKPPDLLLLDMHLGDMNGLDVADALALHPHMVGLRKAGLSADVMPDQLRAARERGFLTYLTKPLEVSKLLRLLDSFVSTQDADSQAHTPQGAGTELKAASP